MLYDNTEFASNDGIFKKACEMAKIPPTGRQASKFRRKTGLAYTTMKSWKKITVK